MVEKMDFRDMKEKDQDKELSKMTTDGEMDELDDQLITNLAKFVKYNFKLLHCDLSHTGLSKQMMKELGPALRRSKSLLCLHLSGNPGVDTELKEFMFNRVHCRPRLPDFVTVKFDAV